jgi:HK97 family phage portal protein
MSSVPAIRQDGAKPGFFLRAFGFELARIKAAPAGSEAPRDRSVWSRITEPFTGAWQRNITIDRALVDTFHADFACKTLIARDIAKLRVKLVAQNATTGIWSETKNPAYDPVLRKPNRFQTRNQFWENWMLSKLSRGNTYVLKERDNRQVVVRLYVLDPDRCRPLVAPDGSVYYELKTDNLAGIQDNIVVVPASEIIHDRFNCLRHPLVGLPPVFASGLAATQGLTMQSHSAKLFANAASPGGILTAPGSIDDENAKRLKEYWEGNFTGEKVGRIAVLGDGLKFEKLALTSVEGQLIEQMKWTAEVVCSTYHVPPYKVGIGAFPPYTNVQSANLEYYSQCLQSLIEDAESVLDDGLGIGYGTDLGTEFDTDNLLRMDSVTQVTAEKEAVGAGIKAPNEARRRFDLPPVEGGETPYLQQQNYSLAALAKRDAKDDPFKTSSPAPAADGSSPPEPANDDEELAAAAALAAWEMRSHLARLSA